MPMSPKSHQTPTSGVPGAVVQSPSAPTAQSLKSREESVSTPVVGSHEVRPKSARRRFKWEDKQRIVEEADRCTKRGEIGALLRREGIYSSQLSDWRRAVAQKAVEPKRGRPPKMDDKDRQITSLERQVAKLESEAKRSAALLQLQKKAFQLLEAAEALAMR